MKYCNLLWTLTYVLVPLYVKPLNEVISHLNISNSPLWILKSQFTLDLRYKHATAWCDNSKKYADLRVQTLGLTQHSIGHKWNAALSDKSRRYHRLKNIRSRQLASGQRRPRSLRLPTEPCVRVRTRLLMQGVSIEKLQTNAPAFGRIVFPVLSG